MQTTINLLKKRKVAAPRRTPQWFYFALAIFGVVFIAAVGILGYTLAEQSRLSSLRNDSIELKTQINSLTIQKQNAAILKDRLSTIQRIIAKRNNLGSKIAYIQSLLPSGVTIQDVTADSKQISVLLSSENLSDINTLIEDKITNLSQNPTQGIVRVDAESLGINTSTGLYEVSLVFNYTKDNIK